MEAEICMYAAYWGVPLGSTPVRGQGWTEGESDPLVASEALGNPRGSSGAGMVLQSQPILRLRFWPLYSFGPGISHGLPEVFVTLAKAVPCDIRQFPVGHSHELSTANIQGALALKRRSDHSTHYTYGQKSLKNSDIVCSYHFINKKYTGLKKIFFQH